MNSKESTLRRKITEAFVELESYRDRVIDTVQAIRNSTSMETTERLIDELLGSYPAHKQEVKRLLTVDGKVVPIDDKRRWAA